MTALDDVASAVGPQRATIGDDVLVPTALACASAAQGYFHPYWHWRTPHPVCTDEPGCDRRSMLVRAAALLVAEIDRLDQARGVG